MKRPLVFCLMMLPLVGCKSVPPLNFSVGDVPPSTSKIDAELKSITVTLAQPDEKTGALPSDSEVTVPLWKNALEDALNRSAVFKDDARRKVSISVKVLKLDPPSVGLDMTTNTEARYQVLDRNDGSVILSQDISSTGFVPMSYAFVGIVRGRESINRSVQANISQFIQALEASSLANKSSAPVDGKAGSPGS